MRDIPTVSSEEIKLSKSNESGQKTKAEKETDVERLISKYYDGDLHTHSVASSREDYGYAEGIYTEEEIAKYYQEVLELKILALSEHSTEPGQPHQADINDPVSRDLLEQTERIQRLNEKSEVKIAVLSSVETNIMFDQDGQPVLDLPDEVLAKLDLVIASRHSIENEKDIEAIKKSLLMAANHPQVDVIGHPDRYIQLGGRIKDGEIDCSPEKYWAAWDEILEAMAKNGKAFEINLNSPPADQLLEKAAAKGLIFTINFDAHDFDQYKEGDSSAKQAWAKGEADADQLEELATYKKDRLQSGPGGNAIIRLIRYLRKMERLGISPDQVLNSSRERLLNFLTEERGRDTANLKLLKEN